MANTRFSPVASLSASSECEYCDLLRTLATERKLRLLDCAIIRHAPFANDGSSIWELLPTFDWFTSMPEGKNVQMAIEILERFADGYADNQELQTAFQCFRKAEWCAEADRFGYDPERSAGSELRYQVAYWLDAIVFPSIDYSKLLDYYIVAFDGQAYSWGAYTPLHRGHRKAVLEIICDIFGNPFRPSTIAPEWLTWNNGTVPKLAQTIYDDRRYDIMPILGDALEDAGCTDAQILEHCRGPGPHVRGCWVVDLILGKS